MSGILNPILDLPAPLATGIAPRAAHLLCFTFTGGYVGSLYLAEALFGQRPNDKQLYSYPPPGHRDHPETMKRRMKAVSIATGMAIAGVYLTVAKENGFRWRQAVSLRPLSNTDLADHRDGEAPRIVIYRLQAPSCLRTRPSALHRSPLCGLPRRGAAGHEGLWLLRVRATRDAQLRCCELRRATVANWSRALSPRNCCSDPVCSPHVCLGR